MADRAEVPWRDCRLCGVPIASIGCSHVEILDGWIVMSEAAWESLVGELSELRTKEAENAE